MRAVICCINSKYIHSSLAPWCLLAGVKEYSRHTDATVVEGTINENENNIFERIILKKPHAVGFCCYIWNIKTVLSLVDKIKDYDKEIKIILGGPEVSYNQKEILSNKNVDFVISGEGEKPFAHLCDCIALNKHSDYDFDGICYKSDDKLVIKEPFIDFGTPVNPYTDEYFDSLKGRIAYIEASRGCPYSCAFCLSGRCGKARFFDFETVKENILNIANSGTKTVKFVDRTFNANHKRCNEIIDFIISEYGKGIPTETSFHFEIAGDILKDDTFELLKKAPKGLFQLEIGMQSFNEKTLEYINRKTDIKKLIFNVNRLVGLNNMHIHIDLIIGLPFEDINSFKSSFNTAFSLNASMLQVGFLKLLYGADMRENQEKYPCEYCKNPPYEIVSNEWLSADEIKRLHIFEDCFERICNSGRFDNTVEYIVENANDSPFDIFMNFAAQNKSVGLSGISLDDFQKLFYDFFSQKDYCDKQILRDKMVLDRFLSIGGGFLPEFLRIYDKDLKTVKRFINEQYPQKANTKRAVAVLYSEDTAIFADYENKHNNLFFGKYKVNKIPLKTIKGTD